MAVGTQQKTTAKVRIRPSEGHAGQEELDRCTAKRIIIKSGRRGGKTVWMAKHALEAFLKGRRVLYAAPTIEQVGTFWFEIEQSLQELINLNDTLPEKKRSIHLNESEHFIEIVGTKTRIKAKTAWNANTLRGDFADLLLLDEWQLMAEDTWGTVGAPMLMDNNGDVVFAFTPVSLVSQGVSKAADPQHASKMFKIAQVDTTGQWKAVHFSSFANPHIDKTALANIAKDMSRTAYRQEILAEDEDVPISWLVYSAFNSAICVKNRFPILDQWPHYVGHDFGQANPAALFVAQNPETGEFILYHEYLPGGGKSTAQHVEEFNKIAANANILRRVGGNQTTEDEIRQGYGAHGWPITAPLIKNVNEQIDRVIGLMERNKIIIFNDLLVTLEQFYSCMWKRDDANLPTNDIENKSRWHCLDAIRYLFSDFLPETVNYGPDSGTSVKIYGKAPKESEIDKKVMAMLRSNRKN